MTRLKLCGGLIRIRKQVEVVHVVNYEGAVAGGLKGGMDLVFARNSSFPLSSKKGKVCISVVNNIEPVAAVR